MVITIDTNVFYQALRNNNGASFYILKLIRERSLDIAISIPVFLEYSDVLYRDRTIKDLKLGKEKIKYFLDFIAYIGKPTDISFIMRPNLKDEDDNKSVELAFVSQSKYLITSNIKDYQIKNELFFDSFEIITPRDFVLKWRTENE